MMALWLALTAVSWLLFAVIVVYGVSTTRRIHPDVAFIVRGIAVLLLMAGVIFFTLAGQASQQ